MNTNLDLPEQELLRRSANGDRDAFGALVTRYQGLVCGLALASCPQAEQSEDVAQEAFVAAWRQLPSLREPAHFKAWLCGIVRRLGANRARRLTRRPTAGPDQAEAAGDAPDPAPTPDEQAARAEELRLVGRALTGLPELYREPLVLFYREGLSIARVAERLDLTEDAVKQRLSRGRALLREELAQRLESALSRTAPGPGFTSAVLSALPLVMPASAAASAVGTVSKGALGAKGLLALPWAWLAIGPGIGLLGTWFGWRAAMRNARSAAERSFLHRAGRVILGLTFLQSLALLVLILGWQRWSRQPVALVVGILVWFVAYLSILMIIIRWVNRRQAGLAPLQPPVLPSADGCPAFCWVSSYTFLGLPLWDLQLGGPRGRRVARGWIAFGNVAFGPLLACGGFAVGGVALGGVSVGLISLGGLALGGITIAGAALGWLASGGFASGYEATGGLALGWHSAVGGLAIAHDFAVGGLALATHANDAAAREVGDANRALTWLRTWSTPIACFAWIIPVTVVFLLRRMGERATAARGKE